MDSDSHKTDSRIHDLNKAERERKKWLWIITVVTLIPVFCLCGLCLYKIIDAALDRRDAANARTATKVVQDLDSVVGSLQNERAYSNAYLRTGGVQRKEWMLLQRNRTDNGIEYVDFSKLTFGKPEFSTKETLLDYLQKHRKKVWNLELSFLESNDVYVEVTESMLEAGEKAVDLPDNKNLWRRAIAASRLGRVSQAFAVLTSLVRQPLIECNNSQVHMQVVSGLEGMGKAAMDEALLYNPQLVQKYKKTYEGTALETNFQYVQRLFFTDLFQPTCSNISQSVRWMLSWDWFQPYIQQRNFVQNLRDEQVDYLIEGLDEAVNSAENVMLIYIIIAIIVLVGCIVLTCLMQNVSALLDQLNTFAKRGIKATYKTTARRKKAELLLNNLLPHSIAEQLLRGNKVIPRFYESATICYVDLHDFLSLTSRLTFSQLTQLLTKITSIVDQNCARHGVYNVEYVSNDTFVLASGVPDASDGHSIQMANFALELTQQIQREVTEVQIKIGIHTGPVAAGVIGHKVPHFSVFGESVKMAERMCRTCPVSMIQLSHATKRSLQELGSQHNVRERGQVDMKGMGSVQTYFLT